MGNSRMRTLALALLLLLALATLDADGAVGDIAWLSILTDTDYGNLRHAVYPKGAGKEELKLLPELPNKTRLRAMFQAIEDNSQASRAAIKAALDVAAGFVNSVALAKKLYSAYVAVKGA